ncbi:serine/threonine-protein kinase [Ponticaulis sp.]|uniref:serine/threonine protein kinase n=1 Tax=Ponticaulis sp. TaxID=2020902 RepID=UPI000B757C64|nr:serine/threonine-protein kinase [Ponticaulis sp.]MAI91216.1 hypothetical protein [Ponticaulis sp.]OUX98529.1 MAG: hypothetical protein CBB65_12280 [Hyphomonadaceae bacterium TMED5]|tara:strand:- start:68094 stop:69881 length:1788 start_codon:yes stop_codon:yes gene_type:complete
MNWQRIVELTEFGNMLSGEEKERFLRQLDDETSEIREQVLDQMDKKEKLAGFLLTSSVEPPGDTIPDFEAGRVVGVWQIERLIGQGGMGQVYEAHRADGRYEQRAALKIVNRADDSVRARFEDERKQLARLEHPGISRIIDGGETETGEPYLVMDFVDGIAIDEYVSERKTGLRGKLKLVQSLCKIASFAHANLILHRDIKPPNILVDSSGSVRLIDFGISALLDSNEGEAESGPLTPAYAAPEQLNRQGVSVATDVFSIGMVLWKLLTNELPVRTDEGGISLPAKTELPKEVYAICAKALALQPSDRYESAAAFADDIERYLTKNPVAAYATGNGYRFSKFVQRHSVALGLTSALILSLAAGLYLTNYFAAQTRTALTETEHALERLQIATTAQAAYTETLHQLFGGEADSEQVTERLLEGAERAHDFRADNPDRAAMIALSLGRYFIYQEDYTAARTVLEPWLSEGYGPEELQPLGKLNLALSMTYTGDADAALPIYQDVAETFEVLSEEVTYEEIVARAMIARIELDNNQMNHVAEMIEEALQGEPNDTEQGYYLSTLYVHTLRSGDFDRAYELALQNLELHDPIHLQSNLA